MWRRKVGRSMANAAVANGPASRCLTRLAAADVGSGIVEGRKTVKKSVVSCSSAVLDIVRTAR